jgi:hypothetical protein
VEATEGAIRTPVPWQLDHSSAPQRDPPVWDSVHPEQIIPFLDVLAEYLVAYLRAGLGFVCKEIEGHYLSPFTCLYLAITSSRLFPYFVMLN